MTTPSVNGRHLRGAIDFALRRLFALALAFFVLVGLGSRTGLYHTVTALSDSMRPDFAAGDLLLVRPEPMRDLRVGQVLTYSVPVGDRHVESHRVTAILHHGGEPVIRTKGDANNVADPWAAQLHGRTAWVEFGRIPDAGFLLVWLRLRALHLAFLYGAPAFFLLLGLARIWRPAPRPEPHVLVEA